MSNVKQTIPFLLLCNLFMVETVGIDQQKT